LKWKPLKKASPFAAQKDLSKDIFFNVKID